jgi:hypothetical protein
MVVVLKSPFYPTFSKGEGIKCYPFPKGEGRKCYPFSKEGRKRVRVI